MGEKKKDQNLEEERTASKGSEFGTHHLVLGSVELSSRDDVSAKEGVGSERSSESDDCVKVKRKSAQSRENERAETGRFGLTVAALLSQSLLHRSDGSETSRNTKLGRLQSGS